MAVRIGRLEDSPLQARRLTDCPLLVCAAPSYLDQRGVPRAVADLGQHNCLGYSLSALAGASTGPSASTPSCASPSAATCSPTTARRWWRRWAARGDLSAAVHRRLRPAQRRAGGAGAGPAVHGLGGIHVVYPPDRRPPAKVRVMIDYLVDAFAGELPWSLPPA